MLGRRSFMSRAGEFQTPIVRALWEQRLAEREAADSHKSIPPETADRPVKTARDSRVDILMPFGSDEHLRMTYTSPWGFVRTGRIIEDLDALAGNVAFRHCQINGSPLPNLVTASVDRIQQSHRADLRDDMTLSGSVSYVGRTSVEVTMLATSSWTSEPWLMGIFTYVARCRQTNKALQVPSLRPETDAEQTMLNAGEKRAALRLELRQAERSQNSDSEIAKEIQTLSKELHSQGSLLKQLPLLPLADGQPAVLQAQTRITNSLICQRQNTNMSGRIFGGFLMRRAFEIGSLTIHSLTVHSLFSQVQLCVSRRWLDPAIQRI